MLLTHVLNLKNGGTKTNKQITDLKPLEPIIKEVKKISKKQPGIKEKKKK
jgi:hypothetical protein